jgi:hypothetical protein
MFFFPIGDDNTQRRTIPFVTYTLIAINVAEDTRKRTSVIFRRR